MKFAIWLESQECPLGQMYGGMPSGGWFDAYTEYEIGAQRIAEAAHCILGSLGSVLHYMKQAREDIRNPWAIEKGHILEEIGIIRHVMGEYHRDVYHRRTFANSSYGQQSIEHMKETAPRLKKLAQEKLQALARRIDEYDAALYKIAAHSYQVIIALADAIFDSVKNATMNVPTSSAYRDLGLKQEVEKLEDAIEAVYG